MVKMNVYFMSIEGNTLHFLNQMKKDFKNIDLHRITDQSDLTPIKQPFFCFVPTYVKGTGVADPIQEMGTLTLHDELGYQKNYQNCIGLVGSGNKNFGVDCYCWTARLYHQLWKIPILDNYEIKGSNADENRINQKMVKVWNYRTHEHLVFHQHKDNLSRLKRLEHKFD